MFDYILNPKYNTINKAINNNWDRRCIVQNVPHNCEAQMTQHKFGDFVTIKYYETTRGYYVQPTCKHYTRQFELFFGFGCMNEGYDDNKTIYVSKY